jgi:transmembrane sensor
MDSQAIEASAARWLAKREGAAWTESDQGELDAWLIESTLHRVAFIRLDTVWRHTARLRALGAGVPPGIVPSAGYWNIGGRMGDTAAAGDFAATPLWRRWYGIAAALVLAVVGGAYFIFNPLQGVTRYATPLGGLETITLADGSRITLNTGTAVRVRFGHTRRAIDIDSGEVYFVVAKDPTRPFVVIVANEQVSAVGTQFSIRRASNETQIIVTDGRVQLTSARPGASPESLSLQAGTIAHARPANIQVEHASEAELDELLSWRDGFVVFRDTALADAVAEFNRYRAETILIGDPSIARVKISGKFRPGNTEAFLWLLQQGFPITVEQEKDHIVLKPRA